MAFDCNFSIRKYCPFQPSLQLMYSSVFLILHVFVSLAKDIIFLLFLNGHCFNIQLTGVKFIPKTLYKQDCLYLTVKEISCLCHFRL